MPRTDAELLIASRRDPAAFRELYDRWADELLATSTAARSTPRSPPTCWRRRSPSPSSAAAASATWAGPAARGWTGSRPRSCRTGSAARTSSCARCGGERIAVELRVVEEMGYAEIAARLDCTEAAARTRVQALLDRERWTAWTTRIRHDLRSGPCGSVTSLGGDGGRYVEGALDPRRREVLVVLGAARSTMALLFGSGGLARELEDASVERCFNAAGLRAELRRRIGPGREVTFAAPEGPAGRPLDARADRLAEGCAVVAGVSAAADGKGVVVTVEG